MEKKTIGKFIAVLRKANGMTQKELGDKLLVSDKTVSRWERDENTPDLSLIPTIADIFGITTDELLRGERNTQSADGTQNDTRVKGKSDKQFRFMLDKKYRKYKNLSLISYSVLALAIIISAICDVCFDKGILGFWLGIICVIIAAVMQYSFHTNFVMNLDEEEEEERAIELRKFNTKIKKIADVLFIVSLTIISFLLPLGLFNMANIGLDDTSAWLLYGFIFAVVTLIVSYAVYIFKIKNSWYEKEELYFEASEETNNEYAKKLLKKTLKCTGILVVITAIVMGIVGNFGWDWFKEYESFDNYEEFEAYMEESAITYWYGDMPREEITEDELEEFYEYASTSEIRDEDGNLLCEYIDEGLIISEIVFSFDKSEDGLPIMVLTEEAAIKSGRMVQEIIVSLGVLMGAEVLGAIVWYLVKLKKGRK